MPARKAESLVRFKVADEFKIVRAQAGFLAHLAERGLKTSFFFFQFAFGEIPISPAVIEE